MPLPEIYLPEALAADPWVAERTIIVAGWETRTRSYGLTTPRKYITCHHTASSTRATPESELNVILKGNSVAPGPISQLFISRRTLLRGPRVYIVAAGTCNHRGAGTDEDGGTGNARSIGIEVSNNGIGELWDDEQVELYARVIACLLRWHKWGLDRVHGHWNYAPNRKVDPFGPATWNGKQLIKWPLQSWRNHVGLYVITQPVPQPPKPSPIPFVPTSVEVLDSMYTIERPRGFWNSAAIGNGKVIDLSHKPDRAQLLINSGKVATLSAEGILTPVKAGTDYKTVTLVNESMSLWMLETGGVVPLDTPAMGETQGA